MNVRVGKVVVDGGLAGLAPQTEAIKARLDGRTVSAADLFAAARELEQAYAAAGYVLVRVMLPAQKLSNGGDVRIVILDGFIERIDTSQLPDAVRDRVQAVLASLTGMRGISLAVIERQLLLAGDTPGTVLRSTLAAGTAPGASVLVVEARYRMVTGFISFDNTLSSALGRYTTALGTDINSPLGLGELVYLRASGYLDDGSNGIQSSDPRNRSLAGGVVVPIGVDGLTLNLEVTDARATPTPSDGLVGFTSDFNRYSARLRYPAIHSRDVTLNGEVDFDAQEERLTTVTQPQAPLSLDRLRVLRASTDGLGVLPWDGVITGRLSGSFGLDALGARSPADASAVQPLSRQGSRPDFQKLEVAATYNQPIVRHLVADLQAHGQSAFGQALPLSEQIGLASPSGLSSFDAGLFQGDSGYVVRGELQAPYPVAVRDGTLAVAPYAFGAYGEVFLNRPTALEFARVRGASYGAGLRTGAGQNASFTDVGLTLEYGRQERSDRAGGDDRVTLTALLHF